MHQVTAAEGRQLVLATARLAVCSDAFVTRFVLQAIGRDPRVGRLLGEHPNIEAREIVLQVARLFAAVQTAGTQPLDPVSVRLAAECRGLQPPCAATFSRALLDTLADDMRSDFTETTRSAAASTLVMLAEVVLAQRVNRYDLAA